MIPEFTLSETRPLSAAFRRQGIITFSQACDQVAAIPYRRNQNPDDVLCVLNESAGTCSTKHFLLKRLAEENDKEVPLMLGVFSMNKKSLPAVSSVLEQYGLEEIPEPHNYFRAGGEIYDYTFADKRPAFASEFLLAEQEIGSTFTTQDKKLFYQSYLSQWLAQHPHIHLSAEKLSEAREKCIARLQEFSS